MIDPGARLREDALACFHAGLAAVEPRRIVAEALAKRRPELSGRVVLAAIGKAAIPMARGAFDALAGRIEEGVVIAAIEVDDLPPQIRTYRGGHPLPNAAGLEGAADLLRLAQGLGEGDLLLALISGGGSALMTLPPAGVSLSDVREATDRLLRSGATIVELNALRKHVDQVKGGRLSRAATPGSVLGLILSDVVGDPLDAIASGPLTEDPTTFAEVLSTLDRLGVRNEIPAAVVGHLEAGRRGEVAESPKGGDPSLARVEVEIVGNNRTAARAAAAEASARGYATRILSTTMTGEARAVGRELAGIARDIRAGRGTLQPPACLVAAGETTVTVRGEGMGGRNQELALAAAISLAGLERVVVASLGTDGIDGPTDAAGAFAFGDTLARAGAQGLDPVAYLKRNDSYRFFRALGDLVIIGPTGTNVMDLQFVMVG